MWQAIERLEQRRYLASTVLADVPDYSWYYGCTPTAVGMILGYWDSKGYDNLIPGDASTMTQAVKDTIAGPDHIVAGAENRPTFFFNHYYGWGDWHNSASLPTHDQNPTSLADYLKTVDGTTFRGEITDGLNKFLVSRGYPGWFIGRRDWGQYTWDDLKAAIDAGQPLLASVDSAGSGKADHEVAVVGYDDATHKYAAYNTFDTAVQWYDFGPMAAGKPYGLASIWTVYPSTQPSGETPVNGYAPSLPGRIDLQYFDNGGEGVAWHDSDAANLGGAYRFTSVDVQAANEPGSEFALDWVRPGEWLKYTVDVAQAGQYEAKFRVSSTAAGGRFHVECDGADITGKLAVPNTGSWTAWQTVRTTMALPAGRHVLRLAMDAAGTNGCVGNFEWMRFVSAASPPETADTGIPFAVGQTIQAEDFDDGGEGVAYHDTDPLNRGGRYRASGVDIEVTTDAAGAYDVGYAKAGEWLNYTVQVPTSGNYSLELRVASPAAGGRVHVESDGVDKTGTISIPRTGGWQTWQTVTVSVNLKAGVQVLRLSMDTAGSNGLVGNVNWLRLAPPPINWTTVQAEDFDAGPEGVAYHDTDATNAGGQYRNTGVDTETCAEGGYDVSYIHPGEWLQYTAAVAETGVYALDFRVASPAAGGAFHLEVDGVNVTGPLTIPVTGGWQRWATLSSKNIALTAGTHVFRLAFDAAGPSGYVGNVNWWRFGKTA